MSIAEIIDAHHHLWDLRAVRYPWLTQRASSEGFAGDVSPLQHDYLVSDFLADSGSSCVVRSVHVQAESDHSDPVAETRWLQSVADAHGFPHGIVAYAALESKDVDEVLAAHCQFRNMRGIRQMLNWSNDPSLNQAERADFMTDPSWRSGFALLDGYGLSFDMQIYPSQAIDAAALADAFPETSIIVDHTGMPAVRDQAGLEAWRQGLRELARRPNVAMKISGLGMFDHHWTTDSVRPFILETIEIFGPDRCMFASNFPVDRLYSSYEVLVQTFREAIAGFTPHEQALLLRDNAARLYRLN